MIAVINLYTSNLNSIINALKLLDLKYEITNDPVVLERASHILLPGVGTFGAAIKALKQNDLIDSLRYQISEKKKWYLGICLGMQILFNSSEENPGIGGLSIFKGEVRKLKVSEEFKIPRIGWCESRFNKDILCFTKDDLVDFYYLHSYHVVPDDQTLIAITSGGNDNITSGVYKDNIYGLQFHPEKSHRAGLKLLESFAGLH